LRFSFRIRETAEAHNIFPDLSQTRRSPAAFLCHVRIDEFIPPEHFPRAVAEIIAFRAWAISEKTRPAAVRGTSQEAPEPIDG